MCRCINVKMKKMRYINSFCYCSTIDEFLELDQKKWLQAMKENYPYVTPYELTPKQVTAWKDEYDVLQEQLRKIVKADKAYGRLQIIFEYVLWDFDNENGVRPDVILLSADRIGIIEFKTRSIDDDSYQYVTSQAKKYRHRFLHNHDESKNMKLGTVAIMTSMKDYYEIRGRVKCISPDRFEDVKETLMGRYPAPHKDVWRWINSDYHFPEKNL